ncbi:MAG: serine/threonine protein kinase [Myxococcales bacterium]|nr:serine/threonine protein kinase [Myxococcales bacterium]
MSDDLATTPSEPIALGTLLGGKFVLTRALGRGGMGVVYEGTQVALRRRVAIKTLHGELARHKDLRARFVREGELAARIRHPNVIEVIDVGEHEGTPFLVLEFLEGEDLGARLGRLGRLSVTEAIDLLLPVCAAVASAHDLGVVHRDLKPENIFLLQPPRGPVIPKVVDFGISKLVDSATNAPTMAKITAEGAIIGTPLYLPPEVAVGASQLDAQSDQYTLGVILYECVTGTRPFDAKTLPELVSQILSGRFPSPRSVVATIPSELDAIIVRAMNLTKAARFPSVWALGRALLPFASPRVQSALSEQFRGPNATLSERPGPQPDAQRELASTLASPTTRTPTAALPASDIARAEPRPSKSVAIAAAVAALVGVAAIGLFARSQRSEANAADRRRANLVVPHSLDDAATTVLAAVTDVTSSATNVTNVTNATNDHADAAPATHDEDAGSALIDAPRAAIGPTIVGPRRPAARDGGRRPNGATTTTTTTTPPNGDPPGGTPFIE